MIKLCDLLLFVHTYCIILSMLIINNNDFHYALEKYNNFSITIFLGFTDIKLNSSISELQY